MVWTDVFQCFIMFAGFFAVLIMVYIYQLAIHSDDFSHVC